MARRRQAIRNLLAGNRTPLTVDLDDRLLAAVREISDEDRVTMSAVVREALDFWIEEGRPVSWYEEAVDAG